MTVAPHYTFPSGPPPWPWGAFADLARAIYAHGLMDPTPGPVDDATAVRSFAAFLHGVNRPAGKVTR